MNGKDAAQGLVDAFAALDQARDQAAEVLIKAANQALGADLFRYAGYERDSLNIKIGLSAIIPHNAPRDYECDWPEESVN